MPKQVLAEEIERFLGTVEGVASARLLTSPSGEIDQIYLTAAGATEARAARRAVVAALRVQYGIPIEPWRVHVTHLKQLSLAALPDLKILRVEETISATETTARIQVAWHQAGAQRTGTGQARGPAGSPHRLRTLAAATIDAARAAVDPVHRRITVNHVSVGTCMDRPVVLVGITASGPRGQEAFVGAAFLDEGGPEAAVTACLDAVTKWLLRTTLGRPEAEMAMDRRARLEAMRHVVRSGGRDTPAAAPRDVPSAGSTTASEPAPAAAPSHDWPGHPTFGSASPPPAVDGSPRNETSHGGEVRTMYPDILGDLQEIRPEQKGGAAMAAHHEGPRGGVSSARPGRQMVEDEFLQPLVERRTPVRIRCRDGYEIPHAVLHDIGTYTLVVEADGATEMVYKHSIISIRPTGARA